jgi:hypothetical protein
LDEQPPARTSRKKAPAGYMTAGEAAHALGIPGSTFRHYMGLGLIPREIPQERSEGFYLATLIEALVPVFAQRKSLSPRELRAQVVQVRDRIVPRKPAAPPAATDWIGFDDLPFVQHLDIEMYGAAATVEMAITWQWWQRNPKMCRILYNARDRREVWGAVTVMPLREETLFRLLRQEIEERDIKPEDILPYEEGHDYSCYVASLLIRPEHRVHLRKLLQSMFDYWCDLYPTIKISSLYANVTSEQGMQVVHHLFFSPRYDLPDTVFELRPLRAGNPSSLVTRFQQCIRQKEEGAPANSSPLFPESG